MVVTRTRPRVSSQSKAGKKVTTVKSTKGSQTRRSVLGKQKKAVLKKARAGIEKRKKVLKETVKSSKKYSLSRNARDRAKISGSSKPRKRSLLKVLKRGLKSLKRVILKGFRRG